MTLEETGVAGRVSNHIESDYVVEGRPRDRVHVQVYSVPEGYDVVLRGAETEDGNREVVGSWRSFDSADEACVQALDIAETHDAPIWADIVELR